LASLMKLALISILALHPAVSRAGTGDMIVKQGAKFSPVVRAAWLNRRQAAAACCDVSGRQYCPCRPAFEQGVVPEGSAACCVIKGREFCPCQKAWNRILPPWE
jgi:hypothetical protein